MIDPSLSLQVQPIKLESPLDNAGKALTLRQLMLSTQKEQQGLDDSASLKSIYAQAGNDPKTLEDLLYKGGFGQQALAQKKDALANRNVQSEIDQRASGVAKDKAARAAQLTQGFLNLPDDQKPIQYANLVAQWNAEGLGPKPLENEPFNPSFIPHMQMIANSGLSVQDAQTRADEARAAGVGQPIVKPLDTTQPQGVPLDDLPTPPTEAPSPTADRIHPLTTVDAKSAVETPDELRAQARELEKQGNAVARQSAKDKRAEANALEARNLAAKKDEEAAPITRTVAIGKVNGADMEQLFQWNKDKKQWDKQGEPRPIFNPNALVSIDNYPAPTPAMDKNGKPKLVQFKKNGEIRETDYSPIQSSNNDERLAAGFFDRMTASEKIMEDVGKRGFPTYTTSVAGSVPIVGKSAERAVQSADQQKYRQAQEDWVRSKLRKESGAAIGVHEMDDEIRTYFPQPGDSESVIEQKTASRKIAMNAMRRSAGPAWQSTPSEDEGWSIKPVK